MAQEHFTRLDLKVKYDQLMIQHGVLVSKYKELWKEHASLKAQHESLVRDHNWLGEKLKALNERNDQLSKNNHDFDSRFGEVISLLQKVSEIVEEIRAPDKYKTPQNL